jgi:lauroyl/myristoyl acyltransferase
MDTRINRLRREFRVLIERFIVPILIAILPWWLGFRIARRLAHIPWFFRERVEQTVAVATRYGMVDDPVRFAFEQRLVHIVDQADMYLLKLRSDRFIDRHFDIEGQWPEGAGSMIALSFHWGAGFWALRAIRRSGRRFAILSARHDPEMFTGKSLLYRYARVRIGEGIRVSGHPLVFIGDGPRPMLRALHSGVSLMTSIDVPNVGGEVPVRMLGRDARLPTGMIKLAQKAQVPIVFFAAWLDPSTGRRTLRIRAPLMVNDRDSAMAIATAHFDEMMATAPAAWHFWAYADAFFNVTAKTQAPVAEDATASA